MGNRYVIHRHRNEDHIHWDLMLERDGVLKTFRLTQPPRRWSEGLMMSMEPIEDHRIRFLDYEGPVQAGRGSITMEDQGCFITRLENQDLWEIQMRGRLLNGIFQLRRQKGPTGWFGPKNPADQDVNIQ